jgi:hypothetical protein
MNGIAGIFSVFDVTLDLVFQTAVVEHEDSDDRDEAENQRVLNGALTFFLDELLNFLVDLLQHDELLLSLEEILYP